MKKLSLEELGRQSVEDFKLLEKIKITVVLDNIRSMHNVGSFFRTSDAFAIEQLYLCGITAKPPHREIHKTALGAENSVKWNHFKLIEEAILALKKEGYKIILIEQTTESIPLNQFHWKSNEKLALVFGNEVFGISDETIPLADMALEIPQYGTKHSFNVSVSMGIVLWELIRGQLKNTTL